MTQVFCEIRQPDEDDGQPDDIVWIDVAVKHSGSNYGKNKAENCPDDKNMELIHRQNPFNLKFRENTCIVK